MGSTRNTHVAITLADGPEKGREVWVRRHAPELLEVPAPSVDPFPREVRVYQYRRTGEREAVYVADLGLRPIPPHHGGNMPVRYSGG